MTTFDDLTRSIRDIARRIAADGKRTAAITRLRMELAGLDRQRKELLARLGGRVDELRRTGQVNDAGLLRLLEIEFENIDRVGKRIQETLEAIQEISLGEIDLEEEGAAGPEEPAEARGDLLDSFEVL